MAGHRVRYVLATKLVNELVEAADEKMLAKTIADQLGYMELDRRGAELLFQVLPEREEKASVAIASNEALSGWTKTFTRPAALRRDRRPAHLRRQHDRGRNRLLPTRPDARTHRSVRPRTGLSPPAPLNVAGDVFMDSGEPQEDLLPTILGICEEFFASTSPAVRHELDTLMRARDITGGPGWLIDMLALTRSRMEHAVDRSQPQAADESTVKTRGD
ncbi:hypothetical protein GCM10010172_03880 [Paractinoplanes ferrugineus]|uniref:IstB-like ATP-binding domain-containing protein n=2 Tax=Paractinoplanes ferrugineus TaxID=113564 RepID=A0A919J4F4_9ACTN|nr:hypothetical protein Afe05nite_56330 [Actinoplanes ferrugineus]